MPDLNLLVEAERRGILPEDKKPLLAEARARGLVPAAAAGPGPGANMTDASKPGYVGPPNDPGLEQRVPFTDPINLALGGLADKSAATRGAAPAPVSAAMRVGELGLRGLQGFFPASAGEVGATMAAGPVGQLGADVAKTVAKPVLKTTGDVLAELAATWTGRSPEAFKALFKDPAIMAKVTEHVGQAEQAKFVDAVDKSLAKLGDKYRAVQDSVAGFPLSGATGLAPGAKPPQVNLSAPGESMARELVAMGHRVPKRLSGYAAAPEGVFAVDSPEYRSVTGWLQKLQAKPTRDFGEALNLRRQLDQEINYGPAGGQGIRLNDQANAVLKSMRRKVDEALKLALPPAKRAEWEEANRVYAAAAQAKAQLKRQVAGETPEQTAMRVLRQLKTGRADENLTGKAVKLGDDAVQALDEIHDRVVARQFKEYVSGHGGGALGVLTTTSPRLLGHVTALAGRATPQLEQAARAALAHPQALATTLAGLIQKHERDRAQETR